MSKISVAIIAKNEATTISKCLTSLAGLADDIVVVIDQSTTDTTKKICEQAGVRVFVRKFDDFSAQRNFASDQCQNDWILSIDADEWLSDELRSEIKALDTDSQKYSAYYIKRLNYIFGKAIRHSNWSPNDDKNIRFFRRSSGSWQGAVHEHIQTKGIVGELRHLLCHNAFVSVEQFLSKTNHYTSLESPNSNPLFPVWKFFRHYFLYLGFLDGWHGLFISYLMAIYGLEVNIKTCLSKK
ncbi:MAG: glycosyltransferase family 2 protein [Patescibacteria group bacterium]